MRTAGTRARRLHIGDLANREVAVQALVGTGDNNTFEALNTLTRAFDNADANADRVTCNELGNSADAGKTLDLARLILLDNVHDQTPENKTLNESAAAQDTHPRGPGDVPL